MTTLLVPGRHVLETRDIEACILEILNKPISGLKYHDPKSPVTFSDMTIDRIVYAITSSNLENTRYSPVPYEKRILSTERFAQSIKKAYPSINHAIYGIVHFTNVPDFEQRIANEIYTKSLGNVEISPQDCIVLTSNRGLAEMFVESGYRVLEKPLHFREPIEILLSIMKSDDPPSSLNTDSQIHPATRSVWHDYPEIVKHMQEIYNDPLLAGELTETRDFEVYGFGMANKDILDIKWNDIKNDIKEGVIVDEGCADGLMIFEHIAKEFRDSDIYGIDTSATFISWANRRREDFFRNQKDLPQNIQFYQANILAIDDIFKPNMVDTTICLSTTHEIWSYGDRATSVMEYLKNKYTQTRKNGRIVIRDVVGPEDKDSTVYMWLNDTDALHNRDETKEYICKYHADPKDLADHLKGLSTYGRFIRFAEDFLSTNHQDSRITYELCNGTNNTPTGGKMVKLTLKDAVEFMTKKDYVENWMSEMHEEFAFYSISDWREALENAGFYVCDKYEKDGMPGGTRTYSSEWIQRNRWEGKVRLYDMIENRLLQKEYPVTNMVLVGEKK